MVLATAVLGAYRISGTSAGIYNIIFYGLEAPDPDLLSGQPRSIRTDEWMVQTPWTVALARASFNPENPFFLPNQNLSTMNVPVAHWISFFKPWLWPFFVLPLEHAFALSWWLRSALLLLASYWVLLEISRNDILTSALGAMAFLFSPHMQWWYANGPIEIASCALLACLFAVYTLRHALLWRQIFAGALCAYFAICFGLILYPPSQIPVALLCVLVGAAATLELRLHSPAINFDRAVVILTAAALAAGLVLLAFGLEFREIISVIRETVYPGQRRIEAGGSITLLRLLSGVYDVFLLRDRWAPALGPNQSEASSFFMFSLTLVPLLLHGLLRRAMLRRRTDWTLLAALGFCLLILAWMLVGLPAFIAQILLLQFVPPGRAWLAAGMTNVLLIYYFLFRTDNNPTAGPRVGAWLGAIAVFVAVWFVGVSLMADAPEFVHGRAEIAVISAASAIIVLLLLLKRRHEFSAMLLFFSMVSTVRVNPLYEGLSPLLDSELSRTIQRTVSHDGGASVWMVYDLDFGNYLAANGARVLGGTHPYPDLPFWRQFDPEGRYVEVYNRFSHVIFSRPRAGEGTGFQLLAVDVIEVTLDPCDPLLGHLGVKYYVFVGPAAEACLEPIEEINSPYAPIFIYQRSR
jgi:hypothetical protein